MLGAYAGGGHRNAGTCQVAHRAAERTVAEIVAALNGTPVTSPA
jgi:nanoRNase/pAp phosphatase (c-di-AMP/oligoRNAs hydrolase)